MTALFRTTTVLLLVRCLWLFGTIAYAEAGEPPVTAAAAGTPRIFPDYTGITLPPNNAPLNFRIDEPGARYQVELRSVKGTPIRLTSRSAAIRIPIAAWRALVRDNPGQPLYVDIAVEPTGTSRWTRFQTVTNWIAAEPIDPYLAYRLLRPLYNAYVHLGIYQRDLETFEQTPILENDKFDNGCLNCHTFLNRRPDTFCFNTRGVNGANPMILVQSNVAARVESTLGYLSWHPSGRLLAFSVNKLSLFSHTKGETRDVYDANSNLAIYRVDSNAVIFPPPISLPDRNETWPSWSSDGRYLYYSSARPLGLEKFRRIRYDLVRVSYDIDKDQWGQPEVLVSSEESGLSACQPKVSPDNRYVLFTMCAYGNFPIYQPGSDLYLLDVSTRKYRRLEINSDQADSWHSWSSNGRWVVFSSKRLDGLFARPHFTYMDAGGQFHKAFVLPQEDPSFYDSFLRTFNVPELIQGRVTLTQAELASTILHPARVLKPQGATIRPTSASEAAR